MKFLVNGILLGTALQGIVGNNAYDSRDFNITAPIPRAEYPYFVSSSVPALHDTLYKAIIRALLEDGVFFSNDSARAKSPFIFKSPEEIRDVFDFSLPERRVDHATLQDIVKTVIRYSPHASHPFKVDRHSAGLDPYGLVGDWMGTVMTTPVLTYFIAPVFTLMEYELQKKVRTLIGYPGGKGGGMMTPGAGMGNGYVIQLALRAKFTDLKRKGFTGINNSTNPVIFVSEDASFAFEKYCIWEGIGLVGCKRVKTDSNGRMNLPELETDIKQSKEIGFTPILLVGVAGTSVLGAIDPLGNLAEIAKRNKMWFHVDGQLAGSNFLSENQKKSLNGIEKSDSFLWSPDKGLSTPFSTNILVTKKDNAMKDTFAFDAFYVFGPSPLYNSTRWDNGDNTMQTTRRPDIVKIWFMWKSKGQDRLAQHIDYTYDLTAFATKRLRLRSNFKLILNSFESNQVSFYYKTPSCRFSLQNSTEDCLRTSNATVRIRENLLRNGVMSISVDSLPSKARTQFFVMNLANSALSPEDVDYMLDQIESEGDKQGKDFESPRFDIKQNVWETVFGTTGGTTPKPPGAIKVPKARNKFPDYVSAPIESLHKQFMEDFFKVALENGTYFESKRSTESPFLFRKPEDLLKEFDFSLTSPEGTMKDSEAKLLEIFQKIIKYSAHLGHPYYVFQLIQALDPYTVMADYVTAAVNSPMLTYEDNPILNIMEDEILKEVRKIVGYPQDGDGLILSGGSAANQITIMLAQMRTVKDARVNGNSERNQTLVVFLSSGAHYSTNKGAFFSGLGLENAVFVDQDERGRMSVSDLKRRIATAKSEGKVPFLVVATVGTTVLGAIDPLDAIATVCEDNGLWLHADGSYGGSTIFSSNTTRKNIQLKGLERSDSFNLNPHKMFGASNEICLYVTKHKGILREVSPPVSYQEFNNRQLYDGSKYDTWIYHPSPDRRGNVFKMWFLWKAKGREGLGAHIDYGFMLTEKVHQYMQSKPEKYILAHPEFPPDLTNVNFYYVPKRYRGSQLSAQRNDLAFWKQLGPVQLELLKRVNLSNRLTMSIEAVPNIPGYLILSLYNSALTFEDTKYMLDVVDSIGNEM